MGGFVFNWLKMPLAWMLGACMFTTIAAFAGLRIGMRVRLRQGMIIIMGVLLGSGFTPGPGAAARPMGDQPLRASRCMTMTGATLCYLWLRRFTGWDKARPATSPPCRAG